MGELVISDNNKLVSALGKNGLGNLIQPLTKEIHLFDTYVAGTTHLSDDAILHQIKVGDEITLLRENNQFDGNAIIMLVENDKKKTKIGYVPAKDNVVFARLMDAGKLLKAKITNIEQLKNFTKIQVGIYMIDF